MIRSMLLATAVLMCTLVFAAKCDAALYYFYGYDAGGFASATMDIAGPTADGAEFKLTITVNNTSPELFGGSFNAPAISAFGFDLKDPDPTVAGWKLTALEDGGATTSGPIVIGGTANKGGPGTNKWELGTQDNSVSLDYLPQTSGSDGRLYSPLVVDDISNGGNGNAINYFTTAVLEIWFTSNPALDIHDLFPNGVYETQVEGHVSPSPYVRFQEVQGGSLKLGGTLGPPQGAQTPGVPEPTSLAVWSLGMVAAGFGARRMWRGK